MNPTPTDKINIELGRLAYPPEIAFDEVTLDPTTEWQQQIAEWERDVRAFTYYWETKRTEWETKRQEVVEQHAKPRREEEARKRIFIAQIFKEEKHKAEQSNAIIRQEIAVSAKAAYEQRIKELRQEAKQHTKKLYANLILKCAKVATLSGVIALGICWCISNSLTAMHPQSPLAPHTLPIFPQLEITDTDAYFKATKETMVEGALSDDFQSIVSTGFAIGVQPQTLGNSPVGHYIDRYGETYYYMGVKYFGHDDTTLGKIIKATVQYSSFGPCKEFELRKTLITHHGDFLIANIIVAPKMDSYYLGPYVTSQVLVPFAYTSFQGEYEKSPNRDLDKSRLGDDIEIYWKTRNSVYNGIAYEVFSRPSLKPVTHIRVIQYKHTWDKYGNRSMSLATVCSISRGEYDKVKDWNNVTLNSFVVQEWPPNYTNL